MGLFLRLRMGPGGSSETKDVETAVIGLGVTSIFSIGWDLYCVSALALESGL